MKEEQSDDTLSISQRAYIVTKDIKFFGDLLRTLLKVNLVFLSIGWLDR